MSCPKCKSTYVKHYDFGGKRVGRCANCNYQWKSVRVKEELIKEEPVQVEAPKSPRKKTVKKKADKKPVKTTVKRKNANK